MRSRHKRLPRPRVSATSQNPPDSQISAGWAGGQHPMGRAYSIDLRERVVAAVESGMSCQSGGGAVWRWRQHGDPVGGRCARPAALLRARSAATSPARSRASTGWLLARIKERDFTLRGLVGELAERGLKVDYRSVWTFVHDEKLSFKKKRGGWRTRPSRRRTPAGAMDQVPGPRRSCPPGLHRRDLDQDQHGAAAWLGTAGQPPDRQGPGRSLERP